jgi:hypothetical protein
MQKNIIYLLSARYKYMAKAGDRSEISLTIVLQPLGDITALRVQKYFG